MNHILLLEDIPEIRTWLKALVLQVFPNSVITECSRVKDALGQLNNQRFTLALLDLGLPDGSGVDVVRALRERQPEVQSVIVTIHDDGAITVAEHPTAIASFDRLPVDLTGQSDWEAAVATIGTTFGGKLIPV